MTIIIPRQHKEDPYIIDTKINKRVANVQLEMQINQIAL